MQLIGARLIVLCPSAAYGLQWKSGYLRASSEPVRELVHLLRPDIQVCIEYDSSDSQQWVCLVDSSFIQAVYIEDCLVWAKRTLVHRPSGVAWPARAFKLLAGQSAHAAGTVVIEYLMDAERSTVPVQQIKELTMQAAKEPLVGHPQLLKCLEDIEEERLFNDLLTTGSVSLVGQEVEVFRCYTRPWFSAVVTDHNLATGELTIMDANVLMPYTLERNKVQIRLPQGVKVADLQGGATPVSSGSAIRKPSSRRSSICAPPPVPPPAMEGNPIDQLGAWSSLEQPAMRPPRPAHTLGKFQSLSNLHSLTRFPIHPPTFRPPNPTPLTGRMGGVLHPDKRTASLCNIKMVDRLAEPAPFVQHHTAVAPLSSNEGVLPTSVSLQSGSLMRSASQPNLAGTRKQRSFDLDHIVSVISRDPSVSNLNGAEEIGVADPPLLPKPEGNLLDEELHRMAGCSGGEEESFQKKALAAKSMPALNRPMGGQFTMLESFLMSPPGQPSRDMTMFAAEPQPLSSLREFRSEVNLARMTNFDPDFSSFYSERGGFPHSQSMTSLISEDMYSDSDSSHDERMTRNGELSGKRNLSGQEAGSRTKRGRGRPRLTEDEKQRRKELRDLGLLRKNKKRRTREELDRDRMERQQHPKQRGRKKGCKRGTLKDISGNLISLVDLQKGDEMLQIAPCSSFVGVGPCQECWPNKSVSHQSCRFVEYRRLRVAETLEESVRWEVVGFANEDDVKLEHLAPWIPLKTGFSGMDEESALVILRHMAQEFISLVERERVMFLAGQGSLEKQSWKRAVGGVRELCDSCYTTLFNHHYVCNSCGFAVCINCHDEFSNTVASSSGAGPSPSHAAQESVWAKCVTSGGQPHHPQHLTLAHIIPKNNLWELAALVVQLCEMYKVSLQVPPVLSELYPTSNGSENTHILSNPLTFPSDFTTVPPPDLNHHQVFEGAYDMHTAPHALLCDGTLLQLLNPTHQDNIKAFNTRWTKGEPVVISNVQDLLSQHLWMPQAFSRDFGSELVDLVDCKSGLILPNIPAKQFWVGFEDVRHRLVDQATEEPMLLKLKDWPPAEDFSEKLPRRYEDFMQTLPLGDYARRDGKLNTASSLPSYFVKPDLGPKLYIAYGSPYYPTLGTTNLHLDMSDAVNVMVYASCAETIMCEAEEERILDVVREECCASTVERVIHSALKVGALWHIYSPTQTDIIREFIRKVQTEQGMPSQPGSDPIHDQRIYLNMELRQRLEREYGVRGWSVAQCIGDAVFIPAGAPHQVRNLCSCIKVAEDFVSPQHIRECLKLTEEFRHLSDHHNNHEDKLQVKNIMYHVLKDAVGVLQPSSSKAVGK